MEDHPVSSASWAQRALRHASEVTNASPGRGSATRAEAQAAEYVRSQLASLGLADIRQQPFRGLRSIWLFFSLAFGMALVGHAAFWLLRAPTGWLAALVDHLFGFCHERLLAVAEADLSKIIPCKRACRMAPARISSPGCPLLANVQQQVVLVAHLDSHRAVWGFASDLLLRISRVIVPLAIYGVFAAPLLYLLAGLTQLVVFAYFGLLFALVHFLAWFTGATADLGPYSPGANDNASAVGTLLALAERLQQEPLPHTEVWLAFTGCEESGCDGMRVFLDEYGEKLKEAFFLDFELVGIGEKLGYLQSEGLLRRQRIPPIG